jgi:hypothetical protein
MCWGKIWCHGGVGGWLCGGLLRPGVPSAPGEWPDCLGCGKALLCVPQWSARNETLWFIDPFWVVFREGVTETENGFEHLNI